MLVTLKMSLTRAFMVVMTALCLFLTILMVQRFDCPNKLNYYRITDLEDVAVARDKSIFFIETSLFNKYEGMKLTITSRTACAVESAAKLHPEIDVHFLFVAPNLLKTGNTTEILWKTLLSYRNIRINRINYHTFVKNTPVESLFRKRAVYYSKHISQHTSDIFRLLVLWKYGGIYLDTDMIVLRSLSSFKLNFIGTEIPGAINGAVMGFSHLNIGHNFTEEYLKSVSESFAPYGWAKNGPVLLHRVLQRRCNVSSLGYYEVRDCGGITVYPHTTFYPLHYGLANWSFYENYTNRMSLLTRSSHTLHLWNYITNKEKAYRDDNSPLSVIARQKCPRIHKVATFI